MSDFTLYGGEVTGTFRPDSRFRYVITDPIKGWVDKPVRGVTTVLGEVLDKPGLRLWARDEMAKRAFGLEFDKEGNPQYTPKAALIKPNVNYHTGDLQDILHASFNAYQDKSNRGKDIGTMTHDFVAQYLNIGLVPTRADIVSAYNDAPDEFVTSVKKAVDCFVSWWNSLDDKLILGTEQIIYSRKYEFSGTYDLKAKINGKVYMLDVKTTNRSQGAPLGIYPEYFMQLGGYMLADEENTGETFDDAGIINVGKDGRLSIATASDMGLTVDECKKSFTYAVATHNWLQSVQKLTKDGKFVSHLMEKK